MKATHNLYKLPVLHTEARTKRLLLLLKGSGKCGYTLTLLKRLYRTSAISMLLFCFANVSVKSQNRMHFQCTEGFIEGTSSLHDWKSTITELNSKGSFVYKNNQLIPEEGAVVQIRVSSIRSNEGKIMDHKTWEAFQSEQFPFITYMFSRIMVTVNDSKTVTLNASGNLSMAGTTRFVSLQANGKVLANGNWQIFIAKQLKMTDFGMEPPTAVLGTIKVGDEIAVHFELLMVPIK